MHRFVLTYSRIASNKAKQIQQNHARANGARSISHQNIHRSILLDGDGAGPAGQTTATSDHNGRPSHGPIPNPALSVGQMSLPETKKDGPHALPIATVVSMVVWIYW